MLWYTLHHVLYATGCRHEFAEVLEDMRTWAQTPLLEASGSTPMLAHIAWNCALKAGSFRMSSLQDSTAQAHAACLAGCGSATL